MTVTPMTMVVVSNLFQLRLLCLFAAFIDNFDVIVEDGCDDRNHISFDDSSPHVFGPANSYVHHTLESKIPFPHVHHILTSSLFQNADQSLDAAIDRQNIANAG